MDLRLSIGQPYCQTILALLDFICHRRRRDPASKN